jgi:hypothetical protein
MAEAMRPGLSVEQCVTRLKRYHYAFKRLHQIFTARITAEPLYELKMGFSHHSHLCAEHATALRQRVGEMREPPLGLEETPHAALEVFFDEILAAPTTEELVLGLYEKALPALKAALEKHVAETNLLVDAPSVRLCRFALLELADMVQYGASVTASLATQAARQNSAGWLRLLDDCLAIAGGLHGADTLPTVGLPTQSANVPSPMASPIGWERENDRQFYGETEGSIQNQSTKQIERHYSATPYKYDPVPRRDERFPDPYNMGVNAEVFLYDSKYPPQPKTLMMFYKRLREIDVPEMMASIISETSNKPWAYYRDMTRQLWDEARHAMMGEAGFANLEIDWPKQVMVNFTWSLALNTQLKAIERHAVLYFIEQGLMPRNGKRFEWEVGQSSGNPLAALFQDYDWADEVLHAKIGRDWYLKDFPSAHEAVQYGDRCWSRVLVDWAKWREHGLTEHRNWWPDLYRAACQHWAIEPDPKVLAYSTTYQEVRADLKAVSGSA